MGGGLVDVGGSAMCGDLTEKVQVGLFNLMEEKDVVALASWLVTFKNTSVNTPKPIKKK